LAGSPRLVEEHQRQIRGAVGEDRLERGLPALRGRSLDLADLSDDRDLIANPHFPDRLGLGEVEMAARVVLDEILDRADAEPGVRQHLRLLRADAFDPGYRHLL